MSFNKKKLNGVSLAVMLGCMAIIASIFGYFVSSWFLDYVTAPQEGIESVSSEQIVTEERIDSNEKQQDNQDNKETVTNNDTITQDEEGSKQEQTEKATMNQAIDQSLYIVQVGAFSEKENAQGLVNKLQSKGFTAYITSKNPYRVQVGAYRTRAAAEELGSELKKSGFSTYIKH